MLTLLLLRHAKSSWTQIGSTDFDRPLNDRGRENAPLIGRYMADHDLIPAQIYCSSAKRAKTTAQLVLGEIPNAPTPVYDRLIYDTGGESLVNMIAQTPSDLSPVLVVGHNPTIHGLALSLSGSGNIKALEQLGAKYPTSGLAIIDFEFGSWGEISGGTGKLRDFILPRMLTPNQ